MNKQELKIFVAEPDNFSPEVLVELEKIGIVNFGPIESADLPKIFQNYDIFWFRLGHQINQKTVGTGNFRCKVVVTAVTGVDHIDVLWLRQNGIKLISLKGETEFLREVRATAEHTISLMLAISRKLSSAIESVKNGAWARDQFRGHELYKKRLGIIGMGRLGIIVADYASALGMEVLGYDKPTTKFPQFVTRKSNLKDLISHCDFVSIHLDLNNETENLINHEILAYAKPGSYWINTSRGGILNDKALLQSLENNEIAGAALDVLEGEPDINKNILVEYSKTHENLIITPHIGGNTYESLAKTEMFILLKLLSN